MEPGSFAFNPNAALYIPISQREDYIGGDESVLSINSMHLEQNEHNPKLEGSAGKKPSTQDPNGSSSLYPGTSAYKQMRDEDPEMDMAIEFLHVEFPELSQDSLTSVYLANHEDIEATMDMLYQLEITDELPENLPNTLDVTESGPSISNLKTDSL